MKSFLFVLMLLIAVPGWTAQTEGVVDIQTLSTLSQHGDYLRLIEAAQTLADDSQQSNQMRGRACIYRGFAMQQLSRFGDAMSSYERALQFLDHRAETIGDATVAMTALATLYIESGQRDEARQLLYRTLRIYEQHGDHVGMAIVWINLASLGSKNNAEREVRKAIAHATEESHRAPNLNNDFFSSLASAEAWLALRRGDAAAAVAGYQHCLELLLPLHGADHPMIGHAYLEIGKSYLAGGDAARGGENMRKGLAILKAAFGENHPQYLLGEVMYAQLLEASGAHAEATSLRVQAQAALSAFKRQGCVQCRVSVAAFR